MRIRLFVSGRNYELAAKIPEELALAEGATLDDALASARRPAAGRPATPTELRGGGVGQALRDAGQPSAGGPSRRRRAGRAGPGGRRVRARSWSGDHGRFLGQTTRDRR